MSCYRLGIVPCISVHEVEYSGRSSLWTSFVLEPLAVHTLLPPQTNSKTARPTPFAQSFPSQAHKTIHIVNSKSAPVGIRTTRNRITVLTISDHKRAFTHVSLAGTTVLFCVCGHRKMMNNFFRFWAIVRLEQVALLPFCTRNTNRRENWNLTSRG